MNAFQDADETLVTEIYAAREAKQEFSSAELVTAMARPSAHFAASLQEATSYLLERLNKDDVVLVLSAGDAEQISSDVLAGLSK